MFACEGARPLLVGCHSSPLKLGAVRVLGVQGSGGKQLRQSPGRVSTVRRLGSGKQNEKV